MQILKKKKRDWNLFITVLTQGHHILILKFMNSDWGTNILIKPVALLQVPKKIMASLEKQMQVRNLVEDKDAETQGNGAQIYLNFKRIQAKERILPNQYHNFITLGSLYMIKQKKLGYMNLDQETKNSKS